MFTGNTMSHTADKYLADSPSITSSQLGCRNLKLPPSTRQGFAEPPLQDLPPLPYTVLTYVQTEDRACLLSPLVSCRLNVGESKNHTPERPFTVVSLAELYLAGLDLSTYRIPAGGAEGCFNDLHNGRPVTLYL